MANLRQMDSWQYNMQEVEQELGASIGAQAVQIAKLKSGLSNAYEALEEAKKQLAEAQALLEEKRGADGDRAAPPVDG